AASRGYRGGASHQVHAMVGAGTVATRSVQGDRAAAARLGGDPGRAQVDAVVARAAAMPTLAGDVDGTTALGRDLRVRPYQMDTVLGGSLVSTRAVHDDVSRGLGNDPAVAEVYPVIGVASACAADAGDGN